jgi:hypothetical protein
MYDSCLSGGAAESPRGSSGVKFQGSGFVSIMTRTTTISLRTILTAVEKMMKYV